MFTRRYELEWFDVWCLKPHTNVVQETLRLWNDRCRMIWIDTYYFFMSCIPAATYTSSQSNLMNVAARPMLIWTVESQVLVIWSPKLLTSFKLLRYNYILEKIVFNHFYCRICYHNETAM
jgi:hypothetical protein